MEKKRFIIESNFIHEGLRCVVIFTSMGHRCGYVGIPKTHTLYGKDYDEEFNEENSIECHFDIHGGITYASSSMVSPIESNGLWWLGFDLAHYMDGKDLDLALKYELLDESTYLKLKEVENMYPISETTVKTLDYCIDECKSLAKQLSEVK